MEYLTRKQVLTLIRRAWKYGFRPRPKPRISLEPPPRYPLVSVIVPTYNWSSVLRLALHSVLWQTEQNFEIFVVGDGCTDDSAEVVNSFGDARIRWLNLPRNSGSQSAPNNAGLELARGTFVAYLGHDDIWHPEHLRTLVFSLQTAQADVASSLVEMIGPPGSHYRVITGFYSAGGYAGEKGLPPSGLMHRHRVAWDLGGWKDYRTIWRNPDTDFVYRALEAGCTFKSSGELTVFKFNSSLRKNSYLEKPSFEQARYVQRIEHDRTFALREALAIANVHLRRLPMTSPQLAPPPDPLTPGWQVMQYRKYRGLE